MASISKYPKPNMTDLPRDLGLQIFAEIDNSERPNREKMHEEAARLERAMKAEREKYTNGVEPRNSRSPAGALRVHLQEENGFVALSYK